jgi:hypothetical protein
MMQVSINIPTDLDEKWVCEYVQDWLDGLDDRTHSLGGLEARVSTSMEEVVANSPATWPNEIWVGEVGYVKGASLTWTYIECCAIDKIGAVALVKAAVVMRQRVEPRQFGWRVTRLVNGQVVEYYDWLDEEKEK